MKFLILREGEKKTNRCLYLKLATVYWEVRREVSWVRQTTTRYETKLNRELDENTLNVNRSAFHIVITNLHRNGNYDLKSQVCLDCTTCNDIAMR